jgi:hypothetical protein
MKTTAAVLLGIALAAAVILITGCSADIGADGSQSYRLDSKATLQAIEILATK